MNNRQHCSLRLVVRFDRHLAMNGQQPELQQLIQPQNGKENLKKPPKLLTDKLQLRLIVVLLIMKVS